MCRLFLRSLQQTGTTALRLQDRHGLRVERNKLFRPKPVPFISDYTVRKVSTSIEHRKSSFHCWPVHDHVSALHKSANCIRYVRGRLLVSSAEDPHKFTKNR